MNSDKRRHFALLRIRRKNHVVLSLLLPPKSSRINDLMSHQSTYSINLLGNISFWEELISSLTIEVIILLLTKVKYGVSWPWC